MTVQKCVDDKHVVSVTLARDYGSHSATSRSSSASGILDCLIG